MHRALLNSSLHSNMHNNGITQSSLHSSSMHHHAAQCNEDASTCTEMASHCDEVCQDDAAACYAHVCMLEMWFYYTCHICDLNLCHAELFTPGCCRYGFQQATDEDSSLRRASIVTEQWLYVFDLDGKPTCKIFSPFASPYKVRLELDGRPSKSSQVKHAAWSRVLGKDPLPIVVLQSRLYATHNISVVLKSQGLYHVCKASSDIATAPGLQATQQSELGLTFAAAVFTKAPQRGHNQRQAGAKRGRSARQNGTLLSCNQYCRHAGSSAFACLHILPQLCCICCLVHVLHCISLYEQDNVY